METRENQVMETRGYVWLPFSVFLVFLFLEGHLSMGSDSIFVNQSLYGNQTIVSAGGVFELGFFKPGKLSNYYIGIWYKKVSPQTIVWVANREKPVSDTFSSVLTISNGNLVLLDESKLPIWSTNLNSSSSGSVHAVLMDDGNLVLKASNSTEPLWRSFDYPTHTWLPGVRLRQNKVTGESTVITSWKNAEDPAPGLFSFQVDRNGTGAYFISWNRSKTYWTSGIRNGYSFTEMAVMRQILTFNFSYVTNEKGSYFTYSVDDSSIITRSVMDISGQIKQLIWEESSKQWSLFWSQPIGQCQVHAFCGAFGICSQNSLPSCNCLTGFEQRSISDWNLEDYSGGCRRKTPLNCDSGNRGGERDRFLEIADMKLPDCPISINAVNQRECESNCLNNCSCVAYAYDNGGCEHWTGHLLNMQLLGKGDASGKSLNVRLAASEILSPNNGRRTIAGAVAGSAGGVTVLVLFFVVVTWSKRNKGRIGTRTTVEGSLVAFGYRDLQKATKNFRERLGGGGFGSVFKGTLSDSTVVAVKKLEGFNQGEKQFRSEVSTIGIIQHINLVRLRGFCSEGSCKMLVYDYMPNGSLNSHLFKKGNSETLDWKTRFQIALGTARGLAYLHEKCRNCIIHCDIKPENILLDSNFGPKLADFGLAKLVGREFSRVLTTIRGTRGYLAPEWITGVAITAKADVFSYGMMLFEFISGRRNTEAAESDEDKFFPTWAASAITGGGNLLSLLDRRLQSKVDLNELDRLCKVACWCVQDGESDRPSMGQVVQILEGVLDVNLPAMPRCLLLLAESQDSIVFFTESSSGSAVV